MKEKIKESMLLMDYIVFGKNAKKTLSGKKLEEWRKFQINVLKDYFQRNPEELEIKLVSNGEHKTLKQVAESFIAIIINEMKHKQKMISESVKKLLDAKKITVDNIDRLLDKYKLKGALEYAFDKEVSKQTLSMLKRISK